MDPSGTGFAGAKILLIEDDPQAVGILEPILISKGFSVAVARDGVEGLEKVQLLSPDLVLCDIQMPRMNGLDVCREVKANLATRIIPVVMLTAMSDFEMKLQALEAGADDFVNKPYNTVELMTRVKSLLRVKYLNEQLDNAEDVLFSMARAIEAKDAYTQGHVERVSQLSVRLADHLKLSAEDKDALRKGGVLHDVGKIGVPDKILNKAGPLTTEERLIIRMHPGQGAKICEKLKSVRGAIPVIRHHHERMDGTGYPDHLSGQEIPILARVMTIVDIYDALTTTRSYRKRLPHEVAMEILWEEANKGWWDKNILAEFADMLRRDREEAGANERPPASAVPS
ncbi:MAG TPA: HD domain-containing phosphohydrolase [Elusimicrobiota bacterium]|nr:HD domain-containing phosphohydrolase [Elusimicrobiota bacterium]